MHWWVGEAVQLVKHWPHKHEEMSCSAEPTDGKLQCLCVQSQNYRETGSRSGRSLEANRAASAHSDIKHRDPIFYNVEDAVGDQRLSSHVCVHTGAHMCKHIQDTHRYVGTCIHTG